MVGVLSELLVLGALLLPPEQPAKPISATRTRHDAATRAADHATQRGERRPWEAFFVVLTVLGVVGRRAFRLSAECAGRK
jgi:hypothetical protein